MVDLVGVLVGLACASHAMAQHDHMAIWSTGQGGGELTLEYDFDEKIRVFESFCAPSAGLCLYSAIDPALLAPEQDEPDDGLFPLAADTAVSLEIVAIDAALTLNVNGNRLNAPGRSARLGTMPQIHNHPSWQLLVPEAEFGDYQVSFKLTTDSPAYEDSAVFSSLVSNVVPTPPGTLTPTPTPTPVALACVGDCDGSGSVTVDELVAAVAIALDLGTDDCSGLDIDVDGRVTVDELIAAVSAALNGCVSQPTPQPVTFGRIQDLIFTPRCLDLGCHNSVDRLGNLVLEEGEAYDQLVGVTPANFAAALNGLQRVVPGDPSASFLLVKLENPRPEHGSRMPLDRPPLDAAQIQLIRDWILRGAEP